MIINFNKNNEDVVIKSKKCLCCNKLFDKNNGVKRTRHHSIPKCNKPKCNVMIPICDDCHLGLHSEFMPKQELVKLKKRLFSLDRQFGFILRDLDN